jgi:predicted DCC family thiol-disulfide oxidoreductase YuxK
VSTESDHRPVIYFDGVCNLCNNSIQFVIKNDKKKQFLFATAQSDAGNKAINSYTSFKGRPDSVILVHKGIYYTRSAAALQVLRLLGGGWKLLYVFILVPPFLRNSIYDLIARNRYRWFGKSESCMMPDEELKSRFID